ncbi:MAG: GNAT family N-acetyltransferase [Maioricimonas sp. JB049]
MITYRSFRNADPPLLLNLWRECELGRGAARPQSVDAIELVTFSQPYFDPAGLIFALDGDRTVGFVHAGFGCDDQGAELAADPGVICAVMVHPEYRRQGIGRELLGRAEQYLNQQGAVHVQAGQSPGLDPFYFGIYGGTRPSGFLLSDPLADPFLAACGYSPSDRFEVLQRDLANSRDPANFRLVAFRRKVRLDAFDQRGNTNWWWHNHLGRVDSVRFELMLKSDDTSCAGVTVVGLDHYTSTWQERAVGLLELDSTDDPDADLQRQVLIVEVLKRLRQEMVTRAEIQVRAGAESLIEMLRQTGFDTVDTGVVYRRNETLS